MKNVESLWLLFAIVVCFSPGFPKLSVHGYHLDNYRFARVPPKFSHISSRKAQLALTYNLFSIARQPITFLLNLLNL